MQSGSLFCSLCVSAREAARGTLVSLMQAGRRGVITEQGRARIWPFSWKSPNLQSL